MGGGLVTEGFARKVELLSYGNIPDYHPPLLNDNGKSTKKQKISVLSDYQVTGLAPGIKYFPGQLNSAPYNKEIYIPNRRRALVAIELTSEGMDNCQSLIRKLLKHPNVIQIAFQGYKSDFRGSLNTSLCLGVYPNDKKIDVNGNFTASFPNDFFGNPVGSTVPHFRLNILGELLTINWKYSNWQRADYKQVFTVFGFATSELQRKVMLINYNF